MENKRKIGSRYEQQAARYLQLQGYEILTMNYTCRLGEIDLIARDRQYLVFVEVKYRKNLDKGSPLEAVDARKQMRIQKAAAYYLVSRGMGESTPCRFDVIGILGEQADLASPRAGQVRHIKNAF